MFKIISAMYVDYTKMMKICLFAKDVRQGHAIGVVMDYQLYHSMTGTVIGVGI